MRFPSLCAAYAAPTLLCVLGCGSLAYAGPFSGAAGAGGTAIRADSTLFVGWATAASEIRRGPQDISAPVGEPEAAPASFGSPSFALGRADAFDPVTGLPSSTGRVVSLGDGGTITLTFAVPIADGAGFDFAVFENAFNDTFLELAFVEVSSDGIAFSRFPTSSLTQVEFQIDQQDPQHSEIDPTDVDGFAGKHRAGWGTPFDLSLLAGTPGLDIQRVTHVRLVDVVGSLDPAFATRDSAGRIVNDPWRTAFPSGGFDLDAVGVLNAATIPEPSVNALCAFAGMLLPCVRSRRRGRTD